MINREIAPLREGDKAEVPLNCLTIAEDFGRAFVQSAVVAPLWNGLGQLVTGGHLPHVSIVNEKNAEGNLADSWAQKFGGAIGMAVDFHLLGKLKLGPFRQVETANTLSLTQRCGQHFARSAKQGALYGAVFTESDPSNNLLYGRLANAGSQSITFGLLGGGSEALSGLKGLAKMKPGTLKNALSDMTIAGVAGIPAGAVGAVADSAFNGHALEAKDIQNAAIDFGIIGFALAGINHGVAALSNVRNAQTGRNLKSIIENDESLEMASSSTQTASQMSNDALVLRHESVTESSRTRHEAMPDESLGSAQQKVRQLLVEYLAQGRIDIAEEIIENNSVTKEDLQKDDIRKALRQGLVNCFSYAHIDDAVRIIDSKLLPKEEIQGAIRQALVKRLSNGPIDSIEKLIERKFATDEDLKAEEVRKSARERLVKNFTLGCTDDAEAIIELKLVEKQDISEAAHQALITCLSDGHIPRAKRIIDSKFVPEEEIQGAVRQALVNCLGNGRLGAIEKLIEHKWATDEDLKAEEVQKAARQRLVKSLTEAYMVDLETLMKYKLVTDENLKAEEIRKVVRERLVKNFSNGYIDDAKTIIELKLVEKRDLSEAAQQGLVMCLSGGQIETAKRITEEKLLTDEHIHEAVHQGLVNSLSNGLMSLTENIIKSKLVEKEEFPDAMRQGLIQCLSHGRIHSIEQIINRRWITEEDLKTEETKEAARQGLVKCLSKGQIAAIEKLIERKLLTEDDFTAEDVRTAARERLVKSLSQGDLDNAQKIIELTLVEKEDISKAARQGLITSLSNGQIETANRIVESEFVEKEEITEAMRQGLIKCLTIGQFRSIKGIIERNWVTEQDLKAVEIKEAARQGLVKCLSEGFIQAAGKILEHKLLESSTIDETFRQSAQSGHITNVIRTGLTIGEDFDTIAREYLGISELTDQEACRLFKKLTGSSPSWEEVADANAFDAGADIFGAARMLRYIFKTNASPHEVLDGFHSVVKMFHSSRLTAAEFYNNVLRQVNRDSGVDDIGHSCARLKSIANNYQDNFDHVIEIVKDYPGIVTIQDLAARFPDPESVFSSWTKLQQYSKLMHFINRTELLPKIKDLRSSGHLKRAKWLEALALHQDSKVAKEPIEDFLIKDPTDFLGRGDKHSSQVHEFLKPSNYVEKPHLDLKAEELRDALIDGSLDRLQVFAPMKVEYEVGGVDLASELKRALGSREKSRLGEAQNPKKLFKKVSEFLEQDNLSIAEVLQGAELSQDLSVKIAGLLYDKEIGLSRPPSSFKLVAEIHKKSDPLAVVAGDDTASCMEFGSGKNNVYMFNPNNALFTIRLERPDGTQRTIAQSVLTKDLDVRELVPTILAKMNNRKPVLDIFPEEGLRNSKAVIAADNVEVHPNYKSETYKTALEGVYRDFFGRYVELYGAKESLQSDKIVIGLGHSDALESLPKEDNTYIPQAPVAYTDKIHSQVSRLSLIAPPTSAVKGSVPRQMVRSVSPSSKALAVTELTFQDVLPLSYLESKMYREVPALTQGLYDLENTVIAKDINNVAKGRPNLSFKYTDKAGKLRGYLLAYQGKVEMDGCEKPAIHIEDFASDSYLEQTKARESGDVGGKLLLKFVRAYKQNYLDKGNMMPLFINARSTTSYALLVRHIESFGRKCGYSFEMKEVGIRKDGSTTMHDVLITPKQIDV